MELPQNFWRWWSITLLIIFLIHLLTLTISPIIWQDEVQIIEYGRLFFEPNTTWSTNWNTETASPNFTLFYLGPALQEIAFRLANYSVVGPRLWSIIGALVASTSLVGWLLSRRVVPLFAGLIGISFLIDPMFVQSYRGDRLEAWVFALIFLSVWLIRQQANQVQVQEAQEHLQNFIPLISAGALTATAFYMWPSAIFLYPLVAIEFINLIKELGDKFNKKLSIIRLTSGIFILSFTVTFILLLIPVLGQLQILIKNFFDYTSSVSAKQSIVSAVLALITSYIRSPFFPLMGFLGIVFYYRRNKLLIFVFLLVLGAVLTSNVYIYRAIYLLPYFALFSSLPFSQASQRSWPQKLAEILVYFSLIWAISFSLVLRPAISLATANSRQPSLLLNSAIEVLGNSPQQVFVEPWEFYPTGRKLKWEMYKPFNGTVEDMLRQVDVNYGILTNSQEQQTVLEKYDFSMSQKIPIKESETNYLQKNLLDKLPTKGASGYGPYFLFTRS